MGLGSFPFDYGPYHPQSDSQVVVVGIRSLNGFGSLVGPLVHSVLYPQLNSLEAIPKYISRSTSYLQVWLAFHPYPHVIPPVFNLGGFGPPRALTHASPCTRIDHLVSGLFHITKRPIQTRFPYGYTSRLNLTQYRITRWLIMQKARSHIVNYAPTTCKHTGSGSISLPSRGAFHLSLTVLVHSR